MDMPTDMIVSVITVKSIEFRAPIICKVWVQLIFHALGVLSRAVTVPFLKLLVFICVFLVDMNISKKNYTKTFHKNKHDIPAKFSESRLFATPA